MTINKINETFALHFNEITVNKYGPNSVTPMLEVMKERERGYIRKTKRKSNMKIVVF
jgi:hypothetical protein